jgi:hypothetical protein
MSLTPYDVYMQEAFPNAPPASKQMPEVDALEFITSPQFLSIDPRPWQSVQIKTFYNLWQYYPPTPEEEDILRTLRDEWKLDINYTTPQVVREMVLVDGRRSGKSSLMSFLAAYEAYSLICKYDPQAYYGMLDRHPISLLHVAVSGEQAGDMFQFTKDRLRKCEFFKPYFDWTKYNESEMRIFTPYDVEQNAIIAERNKKVPRGVEHELPLEGSIIIQSITTKASTKRGKAIKLLIFSEFAHFDRPKFDSSLKDNLLGEETQQTDYAMWKALSPSVKDFKQDGHVLYESSPREKGGQFYQLYSEGGGIEQDKPEEAARPSHLVVMQLSTWQCSPVITREDLDSEFRKDPYGSNMEYGAHFANVAGNFISEAVINAIPIPAVQMLRYSDKMDFRYVISVDPGGQAKKKVADTYAVAWGHYEIGKNDFWVDGMHGWDAQVVPIGNGKYNRVPVDSTKVIDFITSLVNDLGRNYVLEIVYDQWNSAESISTLQKHGFSALETFFTNEYKGEMYGNFLELAQTGRVHMYGEDTTGYIERWRTELKYLQRYTSGGKTFYAHPTSGPCQHDDFADVVANLVYRLSLLMSPTRKSLEDRVKKNLAPTTRPKQVTPVKGGNIAYRGTRMATFGGTGGTRSGVPMDRIRGHRT